MRLTLQKERLTAFVVHDLKNPVGNVDLQAQLLVSPARDDRRDSADAEPELFEQPSEVGAGSRQHGSDA
jgi:hypothetical protein